jgi:hypothetical protein
MLNNQRVIVFAVFFSYPNHRSHTQAPRANLPPLEETKELQPILCGRLLPPENATEWL